MFIFVEALVLIAFILRFKLDADLATKKEEIDQEVTFIQSLKSYEILIRQAQLKLSTIKDFRLQSADYPKILKSIADQTPLSVKITNLKLEKGVGKVTVSINAEAQTNSALITFISGLKSTGFEGVNLKSLGLEGGIIRFVINADYKIQKEGIKSS